MTPFRILHGCLQDALETEARLEGQHPGYGPAFALEFEQGVQAVAANPAQYPPTSDGPRRMQTREYYIRRFQHRLIYAVTATEVVFLAVQHAARRPGSWRHRTRDLN